jgi:hypothetical protein
MLLQLADLTRERRLAHVQAFRRSGDAASFHHGEKSSQMGEVHCGLSISNRHRINMKHVFLISQVPA